MRLVVLESPYAAPDEAGTAENVRYAKAALADCLARNESPVCSHMLLAHLGVLEDRLPWERAHGIAAGHAWMRVADAVALYVDRGISSGMKAGIEAAERAGVPIEYRSLPSHWERVLAIPDGR